MMRLLYVVQRYGEAVAGGSEQHCREFAERLVGRGHHVEVLTTTALSYADWANHYEPGSETLHGVRVHRVPVAHPRNPAGFGELNARVLLGRRPRPIELQREWMRMQGPYAPELPVWLRRRARAYDVVVFVTYLYWTAWAGLRAVAGTVSTVLHPTAHDEPPLRLSLFDELFRLPDAFAFLTPEERDLVAGRFPGSADGAVVGVGVDLDHAGDAARFRARFGLADDPYLLYVGRIDPAKGSAELLEFFTTYRARNPGRLRLVFLGQPVVDVPERDDVIVTGFVDRAMRDDALAGALALVHPSYFESFSMVLTEAFAARRPALVQSRCEVMLGHARRSGGAIPYAGYAEFEAAVDVLVERPAVADELGRRGRVYVEREYHWPVVLDRYEALLEACAPVAPDALDRGSVPITSR
jgi:glycosyltransferase involved in cell wall biosynthesis